MRTAICVPDDLFDEAERLVRRLGKSRSQLYGEALREYVARHDPDVITEAFNCIYAELDPAPDPVVAAAAIHVLEHVEW